MALEEAARRALAAEAGTLSVAGRIVERVAGVIAPARRPARSRSGS
jgi:hypothetical protein